LLAGIGETRNATGYRERRSTRTATQFAFNDLSILGT